MNQVGAVNQRAAHTKSIWANLVFAPRPELNSYRVLVEASKIPVTGWIWVAGSHEQLECFVKSGIMSILTL